MAIVCRNITFDGKSKIKTNDILSSYFHNLAFHDFFFIVGDNQVFQAVDSDPGLSSLLDSQTPVVAKLTLKVGAQVMLMKNLDVGQGLVNGARGVVTGFKMGKEGEIFSVCFNL